MSEFVSTIVNFMGRFVNKVWLAFVDKADERVNNVNKVVNKTKRGLLTSKCFATKGLDHLSTMSTIKMLKVYMDKMSSIYVHNSRPTRARVRIPRIRVFKKTC